MNLELRKIDHIDIGFHTGCENSPVEQAITLRGAAGLILDEFLNGNGVTPCSIPCPMSKQEGWDAGITDHTAVRAAISQPLNCGRMAHHLCCCIEIPVNVTQHWQVE